MCFGQFMAGHPAIIVLFQGFEAHGAENLFRRAEAGEQPLKIVGPFDSPAQLVGEHRLGGARRADDQQVVGGEQRGQSAVDQLDALQKHLFQLFADLLQFFLRGHL
ncbi:MAG: hypothetical protein HW373_1641 [Deltaproteobacteria bacterium]|nr:hypothetical protein [Deltaproteobacteria bacterium]